MSMSPESRSYTAGAPVPARRIVKFGSTDQTVVLAATATDLLIGISALGCTSAGDLLDVNKEGFAIKVEYGGAITRGQPLTSDSIGRAIVAFPAAGVNNRIIGFAEVSGVSGDIGECFISPGYIQG